MCECSRETCPKYLLHMTKLIFLKCKIPFNIFCTRNNLIGVDNTWLNTLRQVLSLHVCMVMEKIESISVD